eukprot:3597987-Amphidinium_carterae.1
MALVAEPSRQDTLQTTTCRSSDTAGCAAISTSVEQPQRSGDVENIPALDRSCLSSILAAPLPH